MSKISLLWTTTLIRNNSRSLLLTCCEMSKLRYGLKLISITRFNTTCNLLQKFQGFSKITPFPYEHGKSRYYSTQRKARTQSGPSLRDFIFQTQEVEPKDDTDEKEILSYRREECVPYVRKEDINGKHCKGN